MKKINSTIILSLFSLIEIFGQGTPRVDSKTTGATRQKEVLDIIYFEQSGMIFQDKQGKLVGVCVEIVKDFVQFFNLKYNVNLKLNYSKEPVFSKFIERVKTSPNLLGVSTVTVNDERKKIFNFTPSYITSPLVLITAKSVQSIDQMSKLKERLDGFRVVTLQGSTHETFLKQLRENSLPSLAIEYAATINDVVALVSRKENYFSVLDLTEYIALRYSYAIKAHFADFGVKNHFAFILPRNSEMGKEWNEFLTPQYKASARYRRIIKENLGDVALSFIKLD